MSAEQNVLDAYVDRLHRRLGNGLAFVVLFGSRARGDWRPGSDYDVLIGLDREDERRFIDRLVDFDDPDGLPIEPFPYGRSEWRRMAEHDHPLLLDVLEEGAVLFDAGAFAAMRARHEEGKRQGRVRRYHRGWRIASTNPAAAHD